MNHMFIPLTQGQRAIVSAEDYESLSAHKWFAMYDPKLDGYYAVRNRRVAAGKFRLEYMHKVVLGIGAEQKGDHIDGNTLHNVRENLRPATAQQNMRNRRKHKNNTSGFKGVMRAGGRGKPWVAIIVIDRRRKQLGRRDTPYEASLLYEKAAAELFGEFRREVAA